MKREERQFLERRPRREKWLPGLYPGTHNSWWRRSQERGWDWEAEDTYLDCLADMVDRIADLEDEVERLKRGS